MSKLLNQIACSSFSPYLKSLDAKVPFPVFPKVRAGDAAVRAHVTRVWTFSGMLPAIFVIFISIGKGHNYFRKETDLITWIYYSSVIKQNLLEGVS